MIYDSPIKPRQMKISENENSYVHNLNMFNRIEIDENEVYK
jgi:hypothetical protein